MKATIFDTHCMNQFKMCKRVLNQIDDENKAFILCSTKEYFAKAFDNLIHSWMCYDIVYDWQNL